MSIVSVCSKIAVACIGVVSGRFSLKIIQPQLTDLDVRRRSPHFGKLSDHRRHRIFNKN
ncbi:hypothetical protein [Nostoc sp.]